MQPFDYSAHTNDVGIEWGNWLGSFDAMIRASRIEDNQWKADLLLFYAGQKVQQLFKTLPEVPGVNLRGPRTNADTYTPNMNVYEEAVRKLNAFFVPKVNRTYERHVLRQMKQKSEEDINTFTIRLRLQAERCGFGDKIEDNVKDQIIQSCQSAALRREFLKKEEPTLDEILRVAKVFETVAEQEKSFAHSNNQQQPRTEDVNKISSAKTFQWKSNDSKQVECNRCGYMGHGANDEKCPAKGKQCNRCGGRDHFGKKCRSRKRRSGQVNDDNRSANATVNKMAKTERAPELKCDQNETVKHISGNVDKSEYEYIFNVTTADDGIEIHCEVGGIAVCAVIDSGSKYNLLSQSMWQEWKLKGVVVTNQRKETGKIFKAYGGHTLPLLGAFAAQIRLNNESKVADFYVIDGEGRLLIGRDTATTMGVLKIGSNVNTIDTKSDCELLGKIKGVTIDIPIKNDAKPVIQPYRRVPVPLEKMVDQKIDDLLAQGIIEKVNGPAKWISPVVVVPKDNDIRLCIDMRRANEAIERENHPLPTIEDFLPHLTKAKIFSKLDIKNAFHQVI